MLPAAEWAERYHDPDHVPDPRTVRSWVLKGHVPGEFRGPRLYVNVTKWLAKLEAGPVVRKPQRTGVYR